MLFKPNILIFIQRGGLLVAGRRLSFMRLEFPEDIVHNLDVLQRDKLVELCRRFFADKGLRGKRLQIVLDYSVVFEKTIELDQSGKPDLLVDGFVEAMPFEPGQRACLALRTGPNLRLLATNADLYLAIADAIKAANAGTLQAITPIAAYDMPDTERTIRNATERILKDSEISKRANYRDVTPS